MGQLQQRLVDFSSNTCSWLRSISSWYKEIIMTNTRGLVSGYLLVAQIVFIVLFGVFVEYDPNHTGPINATIADDQATSNVEDAELYPMFQDVHVMMLIGFGFLMTFLKRHGFGSVGFNFLLTAYVIQWSLLLNGFFENIGGEQIIHLKLEKFLLAGLVSVVGYIYIQPALLRTIGLHDTCGVHNLHGMPGILGACISAVIASVATEDGYADSYGNVIRRDSSQSQAAFQIYSLLVSLALAVGGGLLTGFVMAWTGFDRMEENELYEDEVFWECESEEKVDDEKNELQTMA